MPPGQVVYALELDSGAGGGGERIMFILLLYIYLRFFNVDREFGVVLNGDVFSVVV